MNTFIMVFSIHMVFVIITYAFWEKSKKLREKVVNVDERRFRLALAVFAFLYAEVFLITTVIWFIKSIPNRIKLYFVKRNMLKIVKSMEVLYKDDPEMMKLIKEVENL